MPVSRRHVVLGLGFALAGCAGVRKSKLNPFNWFKKSEPRETIVLPGESTDPRALVETVLSMTVEPMPGGAIVRARGLTPTQGWWDAELVAKDILNYYFGLKDETEILTGQASTASNSNAGTD